MVDLKTVNEMKTVSEMPCGSIFVLGGKFQTENLRKSNGLVVSCEPKMLEQPLMKIHMAGDNYLEFRQGCNLVVGLHNGDVYAIPKDTKCKIVVQTIELKTEDY